jgi:hypothetical protein
LPKTPERYDGGTPLIDEHAPEAINGTNIATKHLPRHPVRAGPGCSRNGW